MVKVLAKMTIKEDMVEVLIDTIPEFIEITRKEEGCIECQLFQNSYNKNVVIIAEEWESNDAHQKHLNSTHFQEAMKNLALIQEKDMEVNICTLIV